MSRIQITPPLSELTIRPGETITFTVEFAADLTSANKDIGFIIPMNRVIVASKATITAANVMVRQNGKYLHNSPGDMLVDGITNTCVVTELGLKVRFSKSDGWGGVNNDPVELEGGMTVAFS